MSSRTFGSATGLSPRPVDVVDEAIAAIGRGEMVVVVDDADRENEGDLVMAAEFATQQSMAFFVRHTSGLICATVTDDRADELDLPLMVSANREPHQTAFTVTIDYRHGTTTGISASDRAVAVRALADASTQPSDFTRPGHLHVLRARPGGVLERPGHTEASVDLARLAGLEPAGVICELVSEDGSTMLRGEDLRRFAQEHGLVMVSIAELAAARRRTEHVVRRVAEARLPTEAGIFQVHCYVEQPNGREHLVLAMGDVIGGTDVLVRVHSECLTGDVFGSLKCDCGDQLAASLRRIAEAKRGLVVYLRGHEGRGIGIAQKISAYALQDQGLDTVDANLSLGLPVDARDYAVAAEILQDFQVRGVRFLTNNPDKHAALARAGIDVVERVPIETAAHPESLSYLRTKKDRMGHFLTDLDIAVSR